MEELTSSLQNQLIIKLPAHFYDLPMELMEKVLKETDLASRLTLRKVSKVFRGYIDNRKSPTLDPVKLEISLKEIKLELDKHRIHYKRAQEGGTLILKNGKKLPNNMFDVVIADLKIVLREKVLIKEFKIKFTDCYSYKSFSKLFTKHFPFKISAQRLLIHVHNDIYLRPVLRWFDTNKSDYIFLESFAKFYDVHERYYSGNYRTEMMKPSGNYIFVGDYLTERNDRRTGAPLGVEAEKRTKFVCLGDWKEYEKPEWSSHFSKYNMLKSKR